jgi:hypothetical protein
MVLAGLRPDNGLFQVDYIEWLGHDFNSQCLQQALQAQATREVGETGQQDKRMAATQLSIP